MTKKRAKQGAGTNPEAVRKVIVGITAKGAPDTVAISRIPKPVAIIKPLPAVTKTKAKGKKAKAAVVVVTKPKVVHKPKLKLTNKAGKIPR